MSVVFVKLLLLMIILILFLFLLLVFYCNVLYLLLKHL